MQQECIWSTPSWRGKTAGQDCAFVVEDQDSVGMKGLRVVRVRLFFSFENAGSLYPCALVEWFKKFGRSADADTGMWKVKPEFRGNERDISILHLDTFLHGAHLLSETV